MKLIEHKKINEDTYSLTVRGVYTGYMNWTFIGVGHEWRNAKTGKMVKFQPLNFALYRFFKDITGLELLENPKLKFSKIKDHELIEMINTYKLEIRKTPDGKGVIISRIGIHNTISSITYNGTDYREALKAYYLKFEKGKK